MKRRRSNFSLDLSVIPVDVRFGASSVTSPKQDSNPYSAFASEITMSTSLTDFSKSCNCILKSLEMGWVEDLWEHYWKYYPKRISLTLPPPPPLSLFPPSLASPKLLHGNFHGDAPQSNLESILPRDISDTKRPVPHML